MSNLTKVTPSVSVLIPVYNRETMIGDCIQSALDQTLPPLEVVVVDNASTDDTWAVCQEFAAKDERVRVFRNPTNLGPVRNWQRCIKEARGDYAQLLFSDDLIYPTFLENTVPYLNDPSIGLVYTAVNVGPEPEQSFLAYQWPENSPLMPSSVFIEAALNHVMVPYSPCCALFRLFDMKKNVMLTIPSRSIRDFPNHGAGPDQLLYLLTAYHYPNIAHIAHPLVFFRSHPDSISVSNNNWYIYKRYQQAKIWFAITHKMPETTVQRLLAEMWLSELNNENRFISPSKCVLQYSSQFTWSWLIVIQVFLHRLYNTFSKS